MANLTSPPPITGFLPVAKRPDTADTISGLLRDFLDHSPAVSWMKDSHGRHVYLSRPYIEKIGVPDSQPWYGKTDFDLWPTNLAERFVRDDHHVLETGEILRFEDRENVTLKDGADRIWWVVKFPVSDDRGNRYVGGIAIDITEQKRAEQERQRLEQEVANSVADEQTRIGRELHDGVGQELTALGLFADSLMEQLDATEIAAPQQATIRHLTDRLARGIQSTNEQVRALSRGLMPIQLNGKQLVAAIEELVHSTNEISGLRCRVARCEHIQFSDTVVPSHLYRVAQEAINNALKHSQATSILVSLQLQQDYVVLEVSDNGIGCPDQPLGDGRGMGIPIMKYRAGLIGATLFLDTGQQGTTVRCKIPINDSEDSC